MTVIDSELAVEIARSEAARRGLAWVEPVAVTERDDSFLVSTNAEVLGGNVVMVLDKATGQVRSVAKNAR